MKIPYFAYVSGVSFFIPAAVGLYKWKQQNRIMRLFVLFCCFSALHVSVEYIFGRLGKPTQGLSNFHQLLELVVILFLYLKKSKDNRFRSALFASSIVYIIIWLSNKKFFESIDKINVVVQSSGRFLLIFCSILALYDLIKMSVSKITNDPVFWIGAGTIIYAAGTIIVITMGNIILEMGVDYFIFFWHINWGLTIIANLFYARSFLCNWS
ncbi:MAG: hypothetical protein WCX28_08285 [Bacteriovoracaceae bacterium]|nr:hypothetical protein [Bacteroidota bacterium]